VSPDPLDFLPEDERVLGCAECGRTMTTRRWVEGVALFAGNRIRGRPYCTDCMTPRYLPPPREGPRDEVSTLQANAIRAMEEDR
jgi:hypothetical protein